MKAARLHEYHQPLQLESIDEPKAVGPFDVIVRIGAACRQAEMSYSRFMSGLKKAGIDLNRKILADMAMNDAAAFTALVNQAKSALEKA